MVQELGFIAGIHQSRDGTLEALVYLLVHYLTQADPMWISFVVIWTGIMVQPLDKRFSNLVEGMQG